MIVKNDAQEKYLAAFYEGNINQQALRLSLHQALPNYMVPRCLTHQDKLPVNTSGKVDRQRIAQIEIIEEIENQYFANIYEAEIAEVWQEVLEKEAVSATENFFEAGGHSLKASRFVQKLWKKCLEKGKVPEISDIENAMQAVGFDKIHFNNGI